LLTIYTGFYVPNKISEPYSPLMKDDELTVQRKSSSRKETINDKTEFEAKQRRMVLAQASLS